MNSFLKILTHAYNNKIYKLGIDKSDKNTRSFDCQLKISDDFRSGALTKHLFCDNYINMMTTGRNKMMKKVNMRRIIRRI